MNQQKSLINLLLVSTAALSGYQKGANNQCRYHQNAYRHRNENTNTQNINPLNNPNNTYNPNTQSSSNNTYNPNNQSSSNNAYNPNNQSSPNNAYNPNTQPTSNNTNNNAPLLSDLMPNNQVSNPITNLSTTATGMAQTENTFLPSFLAALYAADEAVGLNPDSTGPFTLAPLEYNYDDLEPYISEDTLRIHHGVLHQNYVNNLSDSLARYPEFYPYTLQEFLLFPDRLPGDIQAQVSHNAGGHYNHSLVWKLLGPANNSRPTGEFAQAVNKQFGSFENLKNVLKQAALSVVGTGYAWLALNPCGRMIVVTTEEQLTPIPLRTVPLLAIDVWEHAYFLDHEESRSDYIDHLFNLIDWNRVGARYIAARDVFENTSELIC